MNMNNYLETLKECAGIAHKEHKLVIKKLKKTRGDLSNSQEVLIETISNLEKSDIKDKTVHESVDGVNKQTTELLEKGFNDFEDSFKRKSENLSDFTITLFGRTKAGKSTIREALTNGDGSTIGKGAQRTTRDVKSYYWENLRIIDTPGFDAYKGFEDERIAFSQVDETDLILFLVTSDSIEESEFEKLALLRRENKPVIILMNVLYDLNHPVKRKQFLRDPRRFVSKNGIKGHLERLRFLSKKHFEIYNIAVIPIHALSAFESSQESGERKKDLYDASNFKYLSNYLINEVETSGKIKRVQSFRDSYIFHLENSIQSVYRDSYKGLKPIVQLLQNKQSELKIWFDKFIPDKNDEIEREMDRLFYPLFNQLDSFVDQNIENSNFGESWGKKVNEQITKGKIKFIQEKILRDMNRYLDEFFKELKFDLDLRVSNIETDKIKNVKKGSAGRVIRWSSATVSTASAIILSTAVANSWNPVGWGLAVVGIGLGIFSWFWGDDTKRYNRKKAKVKNRMKNNLEKMKRKNQGALKTWFYEEITHGLKKKITKDLYTQVNLFKALLRKYSSIAKEIDSQIYEENSRLLIRLMELHTKKDVENKGIKKIARLQGITTKVLLKKPFFTNRKEQNEFIKLYGERFVEVKNMEDKIKTLLDSLNIKHNEVDDVSYCQRENKYKLMVRKELAGKIFGQSGSNIKTSEKLLNAKITIETK